MDDISLSNNSLVKYLKLGCDIEKILSSIFDDGLLKVTQPTYLNDVLSESKILGYFNEYSPSDIEVARRAMVNANTCADYSPSKEEVEQSLTPVFERYCSSRFPGLASVTDGKDNETLDREEFEKDVMNVNQALLSTISERFGVFSLAQTPVDELMWSHYADNGKGLCIAFDEKDPYFNHYLVEKVSYHDSDRLHYSNVQGTRRIQGLIINERFSISELMKHLVQDFGIKKIYKSMICAKSYRWNRENELRVVYPLDQCKLICEATNLYCTQIPFSAFKAVFIGYNMSPADERKVRDKIKNNNSLSHVRVYKVRPSPYDKLEIDVVGTN